jgi:cytochrome d ubiquinol oxidase subunit II
MTVLGILWFFLIFLLIAGYFVLDGFDLGAGVLFPFLAKNDEERSIIRHSIGPVWDGNEVWLLTAGGALFAAFAPAYATTFSGFYLAIMLVLFGLILRAVSIEFAERDPQWAKIWNICFFVGSLLPALLCGVAVGNIYAGIPMDANGDYAGFPLLGLVTPFTLLCGLLGLAMFMAAGAAWIALKAPESSDLRVRAQGLRRTLQIVALALFVIVSVVAHFGAHPDMDPSLTIVRFALAIVFVIIMVVALLWNGNPDRDLHVFVLQSAAAVALVFLLATSMFPNLVVASAGSVGSSITVATAASSDLALGWMTGIACIGVPLVLFYHVLIYRTFRGRLK